MRRPVWLHSLAVGLGRRSGIWLLGLLLWAGVLFMLSADSAPPSGPDFPFKDKLLHCAYFSGGAFCAAMAWATTSRSKRLRFGGSLVVVGLVFAAVVGALDEWHQSFTPGRMGNDPGDWLADFTGGLLGGWLAAHFVRWISPVNASAD